MNDGFIYGNFMDEHDMTENDIMKELVRSEMSRWIDNFLSNTKFDFEKMASSVAIKMLDEIQAVLKTGYPESGKTDFDIVEEIVCVFEKYKISAGCCHDF